VYFKIRDNEINDEIIEEIVVQGLKDLDELKYFRRNTALISEIGFKKTL